LKTLELCRRGKKTKQNAATEKTGQGVFKNSTTIIKRAKKKAAGTDGLQISSKKTEKKQKASQHAEQHQGKEQGTGLILPRPKGGMPKKDYHKGCGLKEDHPV